MSLGTCTAVCLRNESEPGSECQGGSTGTTCAPPTPSGAKTPGTTSATTVKPQIDVRLPTDIEPLLYTVELQPDMYDGDPADFTFTGSVRILVRCKVATDRITLHVKKLNITGAISLREENGVALLYKEVTYDTERQFMIVHATQNLFPGRNYTLDIAGFVGPLVPDLAGLYLSSYRRGNETIYITTSQMEATDARKTFPCMDEPAIKAEFEATLVRKSHMKTLSNMPIYQQEPRGDGWVADKFQRTPKMSTYLLAFIVCDFDYLENTTENGVRYRAWARPEAAATQAPYSLQVGVDILNFYEDYFNVTYPLAKQDMIAIPDFGAGAMENWGLITYRETAMLYDPGVSSEKNKQDVAVVVAHELAHQWFGNLVTPSWWDDLWLNEGFASYVEYLGVDHVHPEWKMFEQFVVKNVQDVFNVDGLVSSHPVYVPVSHPDEINGIFDKISYKKASSIIRMMKFFLGDNTFRRGLTNYLTNLAYGAAFHDDLWYALGNQSVADGNQITNVKGVMDTWTLQMNFPTIKVDYTQAGRIRLSQSRYLRDPTAPDPRKYVSPFGYKWDVPFTYTTSSGPNFDVTKDDITMMSRDVAQVEIVNTNIPAPEGPNWVVGNVMQYGYYRVNYNKRNWEALIDQLKSDHEVIVPINRAQIINDAWNLAISGDLEMEIALRMTEYLSREREFVPRKAAIRELDNLNTLLAIHPLYGLFSRFMRNITEDVFVATGMDNSGASHLESFLRTEVVHTACSYGIDACIVESGHLFAEWMANPDHNPIDPDIKSTVYCTAVAAGGIKEWEFVLDRYRAENLAAEQSRLLSALSCTKEIWILSKYLEMSIDSSQTRRQDTVSVIVGISHNPIGRALAWDFFRANWDFFLNEFSSQLYNFAELIRAVTSSFDRQKHMRELNEFIQSKDDLGSGAQTFDQALEKTRSNIQWMDKNVPIIEKWLTDQGF